MLWTFVMCSYVCVGYQNAEKQVGQDSPSSSSSSLSPDVSDAVNLEDDLANILDEEDDAEDVRLGGTRPVFTIFLSICLPWGEFTLITALGFILCIFFLCSTFNLVFCEIFSETISISSST